MKLDLLFKTLVVSAALAAGATAVSADQTGLDGIHSTMRVGNKICFDGHSHSWSGAGATQKMAEMQAIKGWWGFTAWEYGSDWAHLGKAIKKTMKCGGSAGNWTCDLEATPCR